VLNYGEILQFQLGISSSVGSLTATTVSMGAVIGTGASGFAFAAAMYFAWALEHREVKLHQARINYLETKTQLENILFEDINNNYGKSIEDKISYLQDFIAHNNKAESELVGYKELLDLLNFRQH